MRKNGCVVLILERVHVSPLFNFTQIIYVIDSMITLIDSTSFFLIAPFLHIIFIGFSRITQYLVHNKIYTQN